MTLECRGQGQSELGPTADVSIATFTQDVLAFAGRQGAGRFIAGGISMGAAIALRLAVTEPARVRGLILSRPAWAWDAAPDNMRVIAEVAGLLAEHTPKRALALFDASPVAQRLNIEAPDNLASLRGYFTRPDPVAMASLLAAIANDGPGVSPAQVRAIDIPTLVIGNTADAIHAMAMARALAAAIPGAKFVEVTAKAVDRARHAADIRAAITAFTRSFPLDGVTP